MTGRSNKEVVNGIQKSREKLLVGAEKKNGEEIVIDNLKNGKLCESVTKSWRWQNCNCGILEYQRSTF